MDRDGDRAARLRRQQLVFYLKGGGAWAHESHSITAFGAPIITDTETRPGWVIGAGAEWALARNWSVKAEYNYVDLGHSDLTFVEPPPFFNTSQQIEQKLHLVKFGINYRFQ